MANPSKPSWRRGTGVKTEVRSEKGWQSRRVRATESAASGYRRKLLFFGLFVLALIAAFVVAIWRQPLATPMFVASVTSYSASLPPNSFAQEDAARLAAANPKNVHSATPLEGTIDRSSLLDYVSRQIERVRPGGPGKNIVMLYISAHGALNGAGEPCLLLSDSKAIDASGWLKMSELLEPLKANSKVKKVLFLDAGRLDSRWNAGVLYNGFPDQLEKLLAEAAVPNLHVVSSVSGGQHAWSAPELGGSVFGFYVARGLQGAARTNDDVVTLQGLVNYLQREVSRHVLEQRANDQSPRLLTSLTSDQDFGIAYTGGTKLAPSIESQQHDRKQIDDRWKQVHSYWRQFEDRLGKNRNRYSDPVRMAQLQQELLRTEQLLLAGAAYADEFNGSESRARKLLDELGKGGIPAGVMAFSLPLQGQLANTPALDAKTASLLAAWRAADGKPPLKKDEKPPPPLEYIAATQLAWGFLQEQERPRLVHFRDLLALIDESGGRRSPKGGGAADFVEIHFLRMIERYVDRPAEGEFTAAQQAAIHAIITNRTLAEQAAAPADERVHIWNQPLVDSADQNRRLTEDQLFGDPMQPVDQALLNDVAEKYRQAISRAQYLADVHLLRDQIWSELPYLVSWITRSTDRPASGQPEDSRVQLTESADHVADRTLELAATMDSLLAANEVDSFAPLEPIVDDVRKSFQSLRSEFVTYSQELKDRGTEDRVTLREIGEVLQVPSPLLAADERERLATTYVKKVFELSELLTGPAVRKPSNETQAIAERPSRLRAIASREYHPAVHLLNRAQSNLLTNKGDPEPKLVRGSESDVVWLARQGERVRTWLKKADQSASELEDVTKNRLKSADETQANIRVGMSEADRLVRAAAALAGGDVRDPAVKLRLVDRKLQWFWQTQRTLDDFWGPPPQLENAPSYFATVANAYLDGARQFDDTPTSPSYKNTGKNLRDILSDRIAAAQGTVLDPRDVRTLGDEPTASHSVHIEWHPQLPVPGMAALFLEGPAADGKVELIPVKDADARDWRRQMRSVGASAKDDISHRVPIDRLGTQGGNSELTASLLYRGHLLQRPFRVGRPESVIVAKFEPSLPPTAKITVKGEVGQTAFIAIIMDCSGSMEKADVLPGNRIRMEAAKSAVFALLDSLELGNQYHVGLRAYSNHYGFSRDGKNRVIDRFTGTDVTGKPGADPDRDVEILVPMRPFTKEQRELIRNQVGGLKPYGVTPLYHSIVHALVDKENDFQFAREEDLKQIIVITDGINEQAFNKSSGRDVSDALKNEPKARGKKVDVLLFQEAQLMKDKDLHARLGVNWAEIIRQELATIRQIATQTRGKYFPADNPEQLITALRDALKLVKFSVTPAESPNPDTADLKELGHEHSIQVVPNQPGRYRVDLYPKSDVPPQIVDIEGGEAIVLEYDKQKNRLVFEEYKPADERSLPNTYTDPLSPRANPDQFSVTPILPEKTLNRVSFKIGIQNVDRTKFTPRPKDVWAQIEPLTDDDQRVGSVYHFYDAEFARDTPVPVFQFVVNDWPASASKAAIALWFKFGATPKPNGTLRVTPQIAQLIEEDIPNVQFAAELIQPGQGSRDWRLRVVERHDKDSDLFTARVQALPTPLRGSHSYYIGVDEVRHEFDYTGETAPTAIITSRERVIEHAIEVKRFIRFVKEN